jgi:DNA gyrase inhibitor GyrI
MSKKKRPWKIVSYTLLTLLFITLIFSGTLMSHVEKPSYQVIKQFNNIEVRTYPSLLVATVQTTGSRKEAIQTGFKSLANFIFGQNKSGTKIEMTAPVLQQQLNDDKNWSVSFIMPKNYTFSTLPQANNDQISIEQWPPRSVIVIRFSGLSSNNNIQQHLELLNDFISSHDYQTTGLPIFAFYNPPWTLPFLRRNEIMIQLTNTSGNLLE